MTASFSTRVKLDKLDPYFAFCVEECIAGTVVDNWMTISTGVITATQSSRHDPRSCGFGSWWAFHFVTRGYSQ